MPEITNRFITIRLVFSSMDRVDREILGLVELGKQIFGSLLALSEDQYLGVLILREELAKM